MALKKVESYQDLLFQIQTYEDEKSRSFPQLVHFTPDDSQICEIDLNSRTIKAPQFLSVRLDHNAEIVYFRFPRYFDNMDLASTVCVVQYINASGQAGLYWVPYYNVDIYDDNDASLTPMMLAPWSIGGLATASSGKINFSVRFYQLDEVGENFIFNMSTRPAQSEILHGIDLSENDLEKFTIDVDAVEMLRQEMHLADDAMSTYWTTL